MSGRLLAGAVLAFLLALPFVPMGGTRQYVLHVVIQIFLWSFIGQAWSLMGRFGPLVCPLLSGADHPAVRVRRVTAEGPANSVLAHRSVVSAPTGVDERARSRRC